MANINTPRSEEDARFEDAQSTRNKLGVLGAAVFTLMELHTVVTPPSSAEDPGNLQDAVNFHHSHDDIEEGGELMEMTEMEIPGELLVSESELADASADFSAYYLEMPFDQNFDPLQAEFSAPDDLAQDETILLQNDFEADQQDVMA